MDIDEPIIALQKAIQDVRTLAREHPDMLGSYVGDLVSARIGIDEALEGVDHHVFPFVEFPRT